MSSEQKPKAKPKALRRRLDQLVRCPHCGKRYGKVWSDEWVPECLKSPAHIGCSCGGEFRMKAVPQKILWLVTPNPTADRRASQVEKESK